MVDRCDARMRIVLAALIAVLAQLSVCYLLADTSDESEAASSGDEDGVHWQYNESGDTLTISKHGDGKIPDYNGEGWFFDDFSPWVKAKEYDTTLKHIVIEEGIVYVGEYSFQHEDHINFESITIAKSVKTLKNNCFQDLNFDYMTIPIDVGNNLALRYGQVNNRITFIPGANGGVGYDYDSDQRKETVTYESRDTNYEVVFAEGIVRIGDGTCYGSKNLTSVTFPNSLKSIGKGAFEDCGKITGIVDLSTIAKSVKLGNADTPGLNKYAFKDCKNIQELVLPINVDTVVDDDDDNEVFCGCENITKITFVKGSGEQGGVGYDYGGDERDNTPWWHSRGSLLSVVFDEGVVSLGKNQCYGAGLLMAVKFASTVTAIGNSAFENCGQLQTVVLPDDLVTLGAYAFKNVPLVQIKIGDKVDAINQETFYGCSSLEIITIGTGVKSIHQDAFPQHTFYDSDDTLLEKSPVLNGYTYLANYSKGGLSHMVRIYHVTLDGNGGSSPEPMYTDVNGNLKNLGEKIPVRPAWAFDGWYTEQTGGTLITSESVVKQTVIYAHWKETKPTSVTVEPSELDMFVGKGTKLSAVLEPASTLQVTWTSSNINVVTVSADGRVSAIAPGSATITATVGDVSGTATIHVRDEPPPITIFTITFDPNGGICQVDTLDTDPSSKLPYLPYVSYENHTFEGWFIEYPSGEVEKVTLDTVFNANTTTVHAHWSDIAVTGIEISKSSIQVSIGEDFYLDATVSPDDATNKGITWVSNEPSIVRVVSAGHFEALGEGVQIITAKSDADPNLTASCKVTVSQKPLGVLYRVTFDANGGECEYEMLRTLSDGTLPTIPTATRDRYLFGGWYLDPEEWQERVSSTYQFLAHTTVYAKWIEIDAVGLHLANSKVTLPLVEGRSMNLTCSVTPYNATFQDIEWTSMDESVVKIEKTGERTAVLLPIAAGTQVVKATLGGLEATCTVEVKQIGDKIIVELNEPDEADGVATFKDLQKVLGDIASAREAGHIPYLEIAAEKCSAVQLPSAFLQELPKNGGSAFDLSTPAGFVYIDNEFLLSCLVLPENYEYCVMGISDTENVNQRVFVQEAVFSLKQYNSETGQLEDVSRGFGGEMGFGIKYDTAASLEKFSVYFYNGEDPEYIEQVILGYDEGTYFYFNPSLDEQTPLEHPFGTYVLVMDKNVVIEPSEITLAPGETGILKAIPDFETTQTVEWWSSNTDVVTVDADGKITAVGPGTATVTGTIDLVSGRTVVTVVDVTVKVTPDELSLRVGQTGKLTATVTPSTPLTVTWKSSDTSVATVSQDGTVTAVGEGTAIITATVGGVSASATVTVEHGPSPSTSGFNPVILIIVAGLVAAVVGVVVLYAAKH